MIDLQTLVDVFQSYGYQAVFLALLACGFGLPIPEDITLLAGGVISGLDYANVHTMFFVSMAGVLIGDGIMFTLGHVFGVRFLRLRWVSYIITPERYSKVQEKFEKYGQWVIFVARFTPGLRSAVFVIAGVSGKVSYLKFFLIDGFAAIISVPIWVYTGYYGAHNLDTLLDNVERFQGVVVAAVMFLIVGGVALYYFRRRRRAKLKLLLKEKPCHTPSILE